MGSGTLQIGVPLALGGADGIDAGSGFLGNLHATLLFGEPGALSSYVGITLPTASELSGPGLGQIVGVLPSLDEPEAWFEDMVALRGGFAPSRTLGQRGSVGLRIGGAALAPTGWENLFVYARFAGWASTQLERARLGADLQTSYAINDDDGFGQQFSSYLDLSAALTNASGQPGVFVRLPLDGDARQLLDVLIGLSAQF